MPIPNSRILLPSLLISIGGTFHYGYQLMVVNPSESAFRNFINSSFDSHYHEFLSPTDWNYVWPLIVNTQTIGGLLGTFLVPTLLAQFGRKTCFYYTYTSFLLSCLLQGVSKAANSWELLTLGRLLCGATQGVQQGLQPVYLNEISPKSHRGLIGSMTGFALEFGFLLSSILALPSILGNDRNWPYLFLVEAIPSCLALAALTRIPESPKFLASREDYDGAARSLRTLGRTETETQTELKDIELELSKNRDHLTIGQLFRVNYIRKGVILGWIVIIASIYSGITALSFFSTDILTSSGVPADDAQYGGIAMAALCFIGAFASGFLLDRFGRRPIMLGATAVLLILNILFIIFANLTRVHAVQWTAFANLGVAALMCFTFGCGPANVIWFLTAELVPHKARGSAHTLAMVVQWLSSASAALIFYPLEEAVYEFCFLLHVVPLSVALVCMWFMLPETKNRTTAEIIRDLGYDGEEDDVLDDESVESLDCEEKICQKF